MRKEGTMVKVKKLGHVAIEVSDVKRAEAFYRDILGLKVSDELDLRERYGIDGRVVFMRSDADHHCFVLFPRLKGSAEGSPADSRLNHIAFEVERLEELLDAARFLKERGVTIVRGPGQHFPGSNYYLDLLDPDGNRIQLFCGMEQIGWDGQSKPKALWRDREQLDETEAERPWCLKPRKLGHLGIFVRDIERSKKFYTEVLGLELSDVNEQGIVFLRCGADHHDTVLVPLSPDQAEEARQGRREIQQISYEARDVEEIYRAFRFLREKGVTIVSGPRRRGPGHDITLDFLDPDGNVVQLYCEMEQIGWSGLSRPKEQWERRELPVEGHVSA